jgi:hypothetical protein
MKTRWINMVTLLKQVGKEYITLNVKMAIDNGYVEAFKANFVNLCDVHTILGLPCICILLLLEYVNVLMKFA